MSLIGQKFGNYVLIEMLGKGGMGEVYLGENPDIGRRVAIKVLSPLLASSESISRRFLSEARSVIRISHPNIIDIFDFGRSEQGQLYYAMEALKGRELSEQMRETPRFPPQLTLVYLEQICAALGAAHSVGVVHRDLKPENIFVLEGCDPPRIKILDFGIAKLLEDDGDGTRTATGMIMGSPISIAPEQAAGMPDLIGPRTDIYSLGVLLFWMLRGEPPFACANVSGLMAKHITEQPPRLDDGKPKFPARLADLVASCLEKEPDRRPASAEEVHRRFAEAVGQPSTNMASNPQTPIRVGLPTAILGGARDVEAIEGTVAKESGGRSDSAPAVELLVDKAEAEECGVGEKIMHGVRDSANISMAAQSIVGVNSQAVDPTVVESPSRQPSSDFPVSKGITPKDASTLTSSTVVFTDSRKKWQIIAAIVAGVALATVGFLFLAPSDGKSGDTSTSHKFNATSVESNSNKVSSPVHDNRMPGSSKGPNLKPVSINAKDNEEASEEKAILKEAILHHKRGQDAKTLGVNSGDMATLRKATREYKLAAKAYKKYLMGFPNSKHKHEIKYSYALCLYYSQRFLEAASTFIEVRDSRLDTRFREEAAFSATKAYEELITESKIRLPAMPQSDNFPGSLKPMAKHEYVSKWQKALDDYGRILPKSSRTPRLSYKAAEISYRFRDFKDAQKRFESIYETYCATSYATDSAKALVSIYRLEGNKKKQMEWNNKLLNGKCSNREEAATAKGHSPQARTAKSVAASPQVGTLSNLEAKYVGRHSLGVNRVTQDRRTGRVTIKKIGGKLHLKGYVRGHGWNKGNGKGRFWLKLSGEVKPVSRLKFHLAGTITGLPDEPPERVRTTTGRFTFIAKFGRGYWRMYEVNGKECVCDQNCGNDFCYISIGF